MRTITNCRSCNASQLTDILSLGEQHLSDFNQGEAVAKFPLDLVLCENCKLVQLRHTTPPELLYTERYGYRSGINNTIKADLKEVVEEAKQFFKSGTVIDIGANDGTLLSYYGKDYFRVGFEPVKKLALDCINNAEYVVNDYFNAKGYEGTKASIITAISCFYDLDDPNTYVADLVELLADDGVIIIQQNYVGGMLKQNAFDNIVHEHLEYYSLLSLENLLNRHGLEVFRVTQNSINGGSFRTFICKAGKRKMEDSVVQMRGQEDVMKLDNKWVYQDFADRCHNIKLDVIRFIRQKVSEGKTVYTYGASTRGNTLLQYCGLDSHVITAAVERNPEKWGLVFAGTGIPIISEEQARQEKPDYMLVLPWFFKEEFLVREKEYLKSGGSFIFPLPNMEVVSYENISDNPLNQERGVGDGEKVSISADSNRL